MQLLSWLLSSLLLLAGALPALAADDSVVRWQDIIGIIQPGNLVGSGTGQVAGGSQPWSTLGGQAVVNLQSGHVEFTVHGLVLAGGNSIGTPDGITMVKGTLVCDTSGEASKPPGNSQLVDTDAVPLSAQGDARFAGFVSLDPVCRSEPDIAFLVRIVVPTVAAGRWIANGAVRTP